MEGGKNSPGDPDKMCEISATFPAPACSGCFKRMAIRTQIFRNPPKSGRLILKLTAPEGVIFSSTCLARGGFDTLKCPLSGIASVSATVRIGLLTGVSPEFDMT